MKSILAHFTVMILVGQLMSCSCAIVHQVYRVEGKSPISEASFQAAAENAGLRESRSNPHSYQKRGVWVARDAENQIIMHSCFCPTPLTLLSWGADARAWERRCHEMETSLIEWYQAQGIALRRIEPARMRAAE